MARLVFNSSAVSQNVINPLNEALTTLNSAISSCDNITSPYDWKYL